MTFSTGMHSVGWKDWAIGAKSADFPQINSAYDDDDVL